MRRIVLILAFSIWFPLAGAAARVLSTSALAARIDSAAQDWTAKKTVPSVSIAVSKGGQTAYAKAFGVRFGPRQSGGGCGEDRADGGAVGARAA